MLSSRNSDLESSAPTVFDEPKNGDRGAVDEVVAPGEETPQDVQQEKGDPYLVQWDGPDDPANPKVWKLAQCTVVSHVFSELESALPMVSYHLGRCDRFERDFCKLGAVWSRGSAHRKV
ncbi:hypothetical protein FS749_015034 [Ceratobasidium sp. UAMH 11750]|nr:hypothetical protein FS749_015034 [Ceratobasidium sp. UAMH 11750]